MNLTKPNVLDLIQNTKGKFFSLTFEKKDGSLRTVNAKSRYDDMLKGGDNKVKAAGYVSAVNRNKGEWFSFKPENVKEFSCGSVKVFW